MRVLAFLVMSGMVAASLSGCAGRDRAIGGSSEISVLDASELPVPDGVDVANQERPYRVGPNDELLIDVAGFPELRERRIVVDGSGRISVPVAGDIVAGGRSPGQIETEVYQRLRAAYIRNPVVSVNVSVPRSQLVTVDGQVREPGIFPVVGRTSLMQSVARARGLTEFANVEDVVIFRTVAGRRYVALYNLGAIRRGAYADPEIFANDVVVVGDSSGRRLFQAFLQASPLLISPLVAILQN